MSLLVVGLSVWLGSSPACRAEATLAASPHQGDCEAQRRHIEEETGIPLALPRAEREPERCRFLEQALRSACTVSQWPRVAARRDARPLVEAVFARPEFAQARAADPGKLALLFKRLLAWLMGAGQSEQAQSYAVITRCAVLGLAGLMAAWGLARTLLRRARARPSPGAIGAPLKPGGQQSPDSPPDHLRRARVLVASQPRESLRESLLALLSMLEARRWARADRVTTNRELARGLEDLGMPKDLQAQTVPLLVQYDLAFYSLAPIVPETAAGFLERVTRLQSSLESAPP